MVSAVFDHDQLLEHIGLADSKSGFSKSDLQPNEEIAPDPSLQTPNVS
jgi:hypothetical protein